MSKSNSPAESIVGPLPEPTSPDPAAAEIAAELSDHLATAAEHLQEQGVPATAAHEQAQTQFGDLAAITRRCYWIKQGDTLMFRFAIIGLLSILCIALGVTTVGSWRSQTRMAEQMSVLSEQLKALAQNQSVVPPALAPPAIVPLEISGQVYLGSPEKPATNSEVMICRVSDGEIVRRIATDSSGGYRSGPLPEGDYTVLAKEPKDAPAPRLGFQSAPVYLYPGTPPTPIGLDVGHPKGQITVELSEPLPKLEVAGKYVIDSRLYLRVEPQEVRPTRWTAKAAMPERWPLSIKYPEESPNPPPGHTHSLRLDTVLSNGDLSTDTPVKFLGNNELLTAGPYGVTAAVVADIKPFDESDDVSQSAQSGLFRGKASLPWMSRSWILNGQFGSLWESKLSTPGSSRGRGVSGGGRYSPSNFFSDGSTVELRAGMLTRLKVEIPVDIVSRIQNLADTIQDAEQFAAAAGKEGAFIRICQVTLVDAKPMSDSEANAPVGGSAQ